MLAIVEGHDEWAVAAFFAVHDEPGKDDGDARKASGYRGRHESIRVR